MKRTLKAHNLIGVTFVITILFIFTLYLEMYDAVGLTNKSEAWNPVNFSNYSSWCTSNDTRVCDETLKDLKDSIRDAFTE